MILRLLVAVAIACASLPAAAANYLWEVQSLSNRIYIYGTIHAGKKEWYPLDSAVEDAFADSQVLAVEADILDTGKIARSGTAMVYGPDDSLQKHVSEADYERFRKLLPRYGLGEAVVDRMKPFMAVSLLVFQEWSRIGYEPHLGIDAYLIRKAKAELKPVVELEGVDVQIELMESLTDAENRQIFEGTLSALESGLTGDQIEGMVRAWRNGDPNLMLATAQKYNDNVPGAKEFEEKFVWQRHDAMLRKIEGFLRETKDRHFVAVGALHLAGPRGLIEMLRKRGYVVKQLGAAPSGTGSR